MRMCVLRSPLLALVGGIIPIGVKIPIHSARYGEVA